MVDPVVPCQLNYSGDGGGGGGLGDDGLGGGDPGDGVGDGQTYGVEGGGSDDATMGSHPPPGSTSLLGRLPCKVERRT